MKLVDEILQEVTSNTNEEIHPRITALVCAFVSYLKEPRYQNPLTLPELARLFQDFYHDLNSLVLNICTQLNTYKRSLILKSKIFSSDPQLYDYLIAIASYSPSSVRLTKRSDDKALRQLRIFAFYKFVMIMSSIENAQKSLFSSVWSGDSALLYDKIFRFSSRDIAFQELLNEKLSLIKSLDLPLSFFCDVTDPDDVQKLDSLLLESSSVEEVNVILKEIQLSFNTLDSDMTPYSKLKSIVRIQKLLITLCSSFYDNNHSKVSNDFLLPVFIYILVYRIPDGHATRNLFLTLVFVKNFCNQLDPHDMDAGSFTSNTSLYGYRPADQATRDLKKDRKLSSSLYHLLNLVDTPEPAESASSETGKLEKTSQESSEKLEKSSLDSAQNLENCPFFSDKSLIEHIESEYFNNGEMEYYLTNFEAILHFLISTPIKDMVPPGYQIPSFYAGEDLVKFSITEILEVQERNEDQGDEEKEVFDNHTNRSRSDSLFNTISSAVSHTVNRSRSSSAAQHSILSRDSIYHGKEHDDSILPGLHTTDGYGLIPVKKFLGRFGLASAVSPFKDHKNELTVPTQLDDDITPEGRHKRSQSLLDRISPALVRANSEPLESSFAIPGNAIRMPLFSSKFSNGVSELMTKFSTSANQLVSNSVTTGTSAQAVYSASKIRSQSSYSIDDPFDDRSSDKRPLAHRSSSSQAMDKWLSSIPSANSSTDTALAINAGIEYDTDGRTASRNADEQDQRDAATGHSITNTEESLFSSRLCELTKFQFVDFNSLTINDLKTLKQYYEQLCTEVGSLKTAKTSRESLVEDGGDS